ncbi:Calponin-1 [Platysternon megacephalum]|uniref:Calponin n=1 Tax=Platysternon megacephalum TaxID=55544 RepID=A0A4D9DXK2_9SAUR|nr:Calponin-1 [Platysternon megacephalum]
MGRAPPRTCGGGRAGEQRLLKSCRESEEEAEAQRAPSRAPISSEAGGDAGRMSAAHFNRGPAYGLSAEVKNKLAQKYDPQREQELRLWIEDTTGERLADNFMEGLKDGVVLCKLINKLQPGSVKKVNESTQNWHQLENISNFIKAISKYGVKPHDIFEANDLFENTNYTQVQSTLIALASQAKTKGNKVNMGVKYAEKHQRRFQPEKLKEGRNVIGLQMGTNKFASQQGMTAYGTRRHLYDPKLGTDQPLDQATISLQMGTNKGASQAGMTAPGTKRQIFEPTLGMEHCDSLNVSLQMGSNKGASQQGMTVYGLPRQVYDSKYCLQPNYAMVGEDEYNHSQHNFYNSE